MLLCKSCALPLRSSRICARRYFMKLGVNRKMCSYSGQIRVNARQFAFICDLPTRLKAGVKGHAAVDVEIRAGDVVGVVTGRPHGGLADVLRFADPFVGGNVRLNPPAITDFKGPMAKLGCHVRQD